MKYGMYCVKDLKTGYIPPTFDYNDESAIRNFEHACSKTESLFFTHPADYQLWCVGYFDSDTGVIEKDSRFLVDAIQYQKEGV